MIKTGIASSSALGPLLIRLLLSHPDVSIAWVAGPNPRLDLVYDELAGEIPPVATDPDWDNTDLYIGPWTEQLHRRLTSDGSSLKAILTGPDDSIAHYDSETAALGVAEFNRKTFVRTGRIALRPHVLTLLGALALMPLARNLLLQGRISGTAIIPGPRTADASLRVGGAPLDGNTFTQLTDGILTRLQTSFNATFRILPVYNQASSFASATFGLDINMPADEITRLYTQFYDDHRHIVVTQREITEAMVHGTNKSIISLRACPEERRLWVTVAFDAEYKAGAGNIVHLLNLLFGLDERTGLAPL